jgi:hypothetical protein
MWPGCQLVGATRSAHTGTASSASASPHQPATHHESGAASSASQPTWHAAIPPA